MDLEDLRKLLKIIKDQTLAKKRGKLNKFSRKRFHPGETMIIKPENIGQT